jgi:hypothetical protein
VKARGGRYISALIQNASRGAATQATADTWVSSYKCSYDVVIDPKTTMFPGTGGSIGLPYNLIIDPRTMKITKVIQGDGPGVDSAVNAMIAKNAPPG